MHLLSAILVFSLNGYTFAFIQGKSTSNSVNTSNVGGWKAALAKSNSFIAKLNLTEKAGMVTGAIGRGGGCGGNISPIPRIGFPGLCLSDGPAAVNRADLVSIFPSGVATAASWDKDLMYQRGFDLGSEFKAKGAHIALGPVAGPLGRHPLGGRNWEGFSPDPYLTGIAMSSTIVGIQEAGVQSCSKHYIGNEQETQRTNTMLPDGTNIDAISSNIGDRTLHELYLWPFADAVKAGAASVMCSYNRLNETYACENSALLNGTLKTELGFNGYVMSDWWATHSGVKSIKAGLDMNMPGSTTPQDILTGNSLFGSNVVQAVNNGSLAMERLDDMVRRIMTPYFLLGQDRDYPSVDPATRFIGGIQWGIRYPSSPEGRDVRGNHAALIRKLGSAGTVLLKNVNSTLPLKLPKQIGVFGNSAADLTDGLTFPDPGPLLGFDIGTLSIGGGSGSGRHAQIVSPLEAIKARAKLTNARVQYITSNTILAADNFYTIYPIPDVCLVFLKTFASEGRDRSSFELDWNSTAVVNNVAKLCPNTIVITHSAGVNTMPWASNPNVTAILAAHFPGEQTGNSIVDILWGDTNPSGRLPYTIPARQSDYYFPVVNLTTVTSPDEWRTEFTEGQFIDYRHFDSKNIAPLYEFGFGLSYTTFDITAPLSISALARDLSEFPDRKLAVAPGGNPDLWKQIFSITTKVSNTGSVKGSVVVQLYVSLPQNSVPPGTPIRVLRGFEKTNLRPGEKKDISFLIKRRDISFWDTTTQKWRLPKGQIAFSVGFSSRDLKKTVTARAV